MLSAGGATSATACFFCVILPHDAPEPTIYFTARFGGAEVSGAGAAMAGLPPGVPHHKKV